MSRFCDNLAWLGVVPDHWQVLKLRQILSLFSEKNHPDMPLLSVVREKGVIVRNVEDKEENHNYVPDDLRGYKLVRRGQFAVNKMKAWQGSYGVSKYDGIVSPAYFVFDIRYDMAEDFFNRAIRSKAYVGYFGQASGGIRVGQWDLSIQRMKEIPFLLPPRAEQDQIVRFLDWKVSEINKLINIKHQEIALLKEQRQRKLSHIITHGLNPEVSMKETGIRWVGSIPGHWKCVQLKRCAKVRSGITLGKKYPDGTHLIEVPYLRVANVQNGYVVLDTVVTLKVTPEEAEQYQLPKGCVLMTEGGDRDKLGRGCVWNGEIENCIHQNHVFAVTVNDELIQNKWLEYVSASDVGRIYFDLTAIRTTNLACTNASKVMAFPIPLPPRNEQETISAELQKILEEFDRIHTVLESQIELLHELKAKIIADAVTGKIDVRGIEIPDYEYVNEESGRNSEDHEEFEGEIDEE